MDQQPGGTTTIQIERVELATSFAGIDEPWRPRTVARLNGQEVKLARLDGSFVWHSHAEADELFLVWRGRLRLELRERPPLELGPGELCVVPRGVEHRPVADQEVEVLLFEPAGTRNTGDVEHPTFTAPPDG